jgi:nucleotide-binding universal stress UspA family protein
MFRKILVATRNPAESDAAVLSAARIAEYNQALLTLLHVIEPLNGIETKVARHFETGEIINLDAAGSYLQEVREKLYKNYSAILSPLEAFQVSVQFGIPWMEILKLAMTEGTDLLLLGAHLQKTDERVSQNVTAGVGSTAENVIKHERCPVMIVSKPISEGKEAFKKLLVSIDFSPSCFSAFEFAVDLTQKRGSALYLFHMLPVPPQPEYTQAQYEADVRKIKQRLEEEFCSKIPETIETEIDTWGGVYPDIEILKSAQQNDVDLIAMGSHTKIKGKLQESKWYVGSAVERVSVKSVCPVAVITDPNVLEKWEGQ